MAKQYFSSETDIAIANQKQTMFVVTTTIIFLPYSIAVNYSHNNSQRNSSIKFVNWISFFRWQIEQYSLSRSTYLFLFEWPFLVHFKYIVKKNLGTGGYKVNLLYCDHDQAELKFSVLHNIIIILYYDGEVKLHKFHRYDNYQKRFSNWVWKTFSINKKHRR